MTLGHRPDEALRAGLARWWAHAHPAALDVRIDDIERPSSGWSNETVLATITSSLGTDRLAVRMPTIVPSYPRYDLGAQASVQQALLDAGVPAPRPIAVECDEQWLGAPFLAMERAPGRSVGDAPALDPWLTGLDGTVQRRVHDGFLSVLAAVHRLDWRAAGLGGVLRGAGGGLVEEVRAWIDYIEWAADDGRPAPRLADLAAWCAAHAPPEEPPASLCWGDARLGNLLCGDDGEVLAALDWELASIGPAEMDLAWYLAMDDVATAFIERTVPGFHDRAGAIARYEELAGRRVRDLRWHEVFALVRAAAVNDRQARIAAAVGAAYPGVAGDDNPLFDFAERIAHEIESGHA